MSWPWPYCISAARCPEERNSNRFKESFNTYDTSMDSPGWRWHSASNIGHDWGKCLTVFSLVTQCQQLGQYPTKMPYRFAVCVWRGTFERTGNKCVARLQIRSRDIYHNHLGLLIMMTPQNMLLCNVFYNSMQNIYLWKNAKTTEDVTSM